MGAGRISRLTAHAVGTAKGATEAHRTEISDRKAAVEIGEVRGLGKHVSDMVVAVVDLAAVVCGGIGKIVLDAGQTVQVVISKDLGVAPGVRRGDGRGRAEIGNGFDVGNGVETVAKRDQGRGGTRPYRIEGGEPKAGIVIIGGLNSIAVVNQIGR